jgi:hypothetical protein
MPFLLLWLLSQTKVAKDGRYYLTLHGKVKYLPNGAVEHLVKKVSNPMTDRQVGYIRHLFKEVSDYLSDQERKNLTDKMKAHRSGQQVQSVDWADKAIKKLVSRRKA